MDVVRGPGRGLMLSGEAALAKGTGFRRLRGVVERLADLHLDKWEIDGCPPDSILVFRPRKILEIGYV